jgi:hypothetical protein
MDGETPRDKEVEVMSALFQDDLSLEDTNCMRIVLKPYTASSKAYSCTLCVRISEHYPYNKPSFSFDDVEGIDEEQEDELLSLIEDFVHDNIGNTLSVSLLLNAR